MKGTFDVNQDKKIYRINLEGFAEAETTTKAVDGLIEKLNGFPVADWSIVIDCQNLSTFKPDILPILARCYKDIYEKFGKAVLINPKKAVGRSQLQRIARETNFTGSFVDTEQEMLNIIEG
jgi:hypothetical protein